MNECVNVAATNGAISRPATRNVIALVAAIQIHMVIKRPVYINRCSSHNGWALPHPAATRNRVAAIRHRHAPHDDAQKFAAIH